MKPMLTIDIEKAEKMMPNYPHAKFSKEAESLNTFKAVESIKSVDQINKQVASQNLTITKKKPIFKTESYEEEKMPGVYSLETREVNILNYILRFIVSNKLNSTISFMMLKH